MIHIFEHRGIYLRVDYEPTVPPTFNSVRVVDANYRPIGPDLQPLLHDTLLVTTPAMGGADAEAQTFLSSIVEDLP